jgi:UDP-2-acetamido-3-amino-2,3-dideoxy-glucuronate N-acetyltransferase
VPVTGASIHPTALCEPSATVGAGSRVDAFAILGEDVVLGEGVRVRSGARLLPGTRLGRGVVIGENAVLGGAERCDVGPDVVIGANATVLPGVRVERHAIVEPGSVVADAVPANAIVRGNPARIIGYVGGELESPTTRIAGVAERSTPRQTRVRGVRTEPLTLREDLRGSLMAAEFAELPFTPARLFTVFAVQGEHIRGSHAHRQCQQFLVCVAGTLSCVVDDGVAREEILLDHPGVGVYVPPMIWGTQYKYSSDALLLVLASHRYDPDDYIRDYDEFLSLAQDGAGL